MVKVLNSIKKFPNLYSSVDSGLCAVLARAVPWLRLLRGPRDNSGEDERAEVRIQGIYVWGYWKTFTFYKPTLCKSGVYNWRKRKKTP